MNFVEDGTKSDWRVCKRRRISLKEDKLHRIVSFPPIFFLSLSLSLFESKLLAKEKLPLRDRLLKTTPSYVRSFRLSTAWNVKAETLLGRVRSTVRIIDLAKSVMS